MGASSAKTFGASSAKQRAAPGDEDVEGHRHTRGAASAKTMGASSAKSYGASSAKQRATPGDEDVEGHKQQR